MCESYIGTALVEQWYGELISAVSSGDSLAVGGWVQVIKAGESDATRWRSWLAYLQSEVMCEQQVAAPSPT